MKSPVIAAIVLLLSISAAAVALATVANVPHFRDVGYPDSATMVAVRGALTSGRLYPPLDGPPYMVTVYGPLTYSLLAIPYRLAELAGGRPEVAVRATLAFAFVACLAMIFLISRRLQPSWRVAALCVLFAAAVLPLARWTTQVRGDFPALALSLLSVYIILLKPGPLWRTAGAGICAGLALLVKQTFVSAPFAIVLWLLWTRRIKAATVFAAATLVLVTSGYSFVLWREPLMDAHLVALRNPIVEYRGAMLMVWTALAQPVVPFAVAGALFAIRRGGAEERLVVLLSLAAWLVASLTVLQVGANINYFWEPLFASALLAGPAMQRLHRHLDRTSALAVMTVLFVVVHASLPWARESVDSIQHSAKQMRNHDDRRARWEEFLSVVRGRRLLSTIPSVTFHSSSPEVPDPFLNTLLETRGWSPAPVIANIKSAQYELVVVLNADAARAPFYRGWPVWSEEMWRAVDSVYRPACALNDMEIRLPGNRSHELYERLTSIGCTPITSGIHARPQAQPAARGVMPL